jgi:hypothetical protein
MSAAIRLADITAADVGVARARLPRAFGAPWSERAVHAALAVAVVGWLGYLHWLFDFGRISSGLDRLWVIVGLMVDWSQFAGWDHVEILKSMLETVTMAFLGRCSRPSSRCRLVSSAPATSSRAAFSASSRAGSSTCSADSIS